MGLREELEQIRNNSKTEKRAHLDYLIKEAVRNKSYVAYYGYIGGEDFQETSEVINGIRNELSYLYDIKCETLEEPITVTVDQKEIGRFPRTIKIIIDRK